MGSNNSSPHPQQSEQERWEIAHNLSQNDTVTINNEHENLTVSNIRPNAESGLVTEISLTTTTNNTFTIRVINDDITIPLLTRPDNEQIPITSITPPDTEILAGTTARDLYGAKITEHNVDPTDTYPEKRSNTPNLETNELTIIGECPACNCLVAENNETATCTNCGAWSPIEQWNTYHNNQNTSNTATTETGKQLSQTSLIDDWDSTPAPPANTK